MHEASAAPLLVVATWRDEEVRRHPEQETVLADVARAGRALLLGGLGVEEVGSLLRTRLGDRLDPELPGAVAELTGGNPLFVLEVAYTLGGAAAKMSTLNAGAHGGGIPDCLATCVEREVACRADQALESATPRLVELLGRGGLALP